MRSAAFILIVVIGSWYGMQAVHELGHVIGALGRIESVSLPLIGFSMTRYAEGGDTLPAIAGGPIFGGLLPCLLLVIPRRRLAGRTGWFFCGFCLIVNGVYIAAGSFIAGGDAADLVQRNVPPIVLVLLGTCSTLAGLFVLHRNGRWAGLVH
jgi:hypothetical protein